MADAHTLTKSIVRGNGAVISRVRCSCGFTAEAPRLSTAARRKRDREVEAHLATPRQSEDA